MGRKALPDFEFNQNKEKKKKKQRVWYSMYSFVQKKENEKRILKYNQKYKHCCTYFPYSMAMVAKLKKATRIKQNTKIL